ncbi:MAG: MurR/RpiR family transcriptional regulator, partial [Loktanella sp.]|nr:MurR/RpiR family transcriptional regulator [Loktanella sp.]
MSILTLIAAQMNTLTHGERAIASVILDRPEDVTRMSSTDLASAAGRSQSGVIKLCQKLGFNGYQDLRLDIARATAPDIRSDGHAAGVHGTIEAGDDLTLTMQKLLASKIHAMRETL